MRPIRTLLHPTDFSDHSAVALRLACSLARHYGARLIVLHAIAPSGFDLSKAIEEELQAAPVDQTALEEKLGLLRAADDEIRLESRLVEGDPVAAILREADLVQCDLIVMGTRGRSEVSRVLAGSVAEAVARRARCPVLTVKAPAQTLPYAQETLFLGTAKE
jgi:nucleotide-binding universal stress UspA family protein